MFQRDVLRLEISSQAWEKDNFSLFFRTSTVFVDFVGVIEMIGGKQCS